MYLFTISQVLKLLTYIRRKSAMNSFTILWRILFSLPNTVRQKDENTACGAKWYHSTVPVPYVKIKITEIPFERSSILRYRKRPCPPQERFLTLTFLRKKLSVDTLSKVQNQTITDFLFDPLSPRSDQREISPYNINALENRLVMRIEYMKQGRWV